MPLTKYARFEVLSAELAPNRLARTAGRVVNFRHAHRHAFQYDPKPGFLYVRSRAISSRCNDNFDEFPADEIKQAYATFIGKPVFVNHNNSNHRRLRGVCIAAALHEDTNPDGSPDTWTEVLMEIDAVRFPKLAQAILAGHIDRTSMGTDVAYSLCSFCGNRATTPLEYCAHIPKLKGKRIRRTLASGAKEDVLVREICHGLRFFENSVLVEPPADPTAYFLGVETGPGVTASRHTAALDPEAIKDGARRHARRKKHYISNWSHGGGGWLIGPCGRCGATIGCHSSGAISPSPTINQPCTGSSDALSQSGAPASSTTAAAQLATRYECVHNLSTLCTRGDGKPTRKKCGYCGGELRTEQGLWGVFPWTKENRYPHGNAVSTHASKKKAESVADSDEGRNANHVVRWIPSNSIQSSLQRAAALIAEAAHTAAADDHARANWTTWKGVKPGDRVAPAQGGYVYSSEEKARTTERRPFGTYQGVIEHQPPRYTRPVKSHHVIYDDGSESFHHRGAQKILHLPREQKESALSRAAALIEQAMQVEAEKGNNLTIDFFGIQQTCTSEQASLVLDFLMASRQAGYTHQPKSKYGFDDTWVVQYPWTPEEVGGESMAQARRDFLVEKGIPAKFMKVSSRHHAYGEVVAPAKVDTLRDEVCPVCGESDSFDGDKCMVCGYVKPPDEFMDPDLDKARNTDLRQEKDDDLNLGGPGDLTCENCGQDYLSKEMAGDDPLGSDTNTGDEYQDAESNPVDAQTDDDNAAKPDTNPDTDPAKLPHLNKPKKPDVEDAAQPDGKLPKSKDTQTKQKAGDTCPNCGKGTLKPKGDAKGDGNAFVPPTGDEASPQDGAEDQDETQDDDDKDGKGKKKPPWMKGDKKAAALSRAAYLVQRCEADEQKENSMRPALAALAEQQRVITAQDQTINRLRGAVAFIAEAAGLSEHPAITAALEEGVLQATADVNNPAQPVPDPGSQGPVQTTEQALAPAGRDDPESIGASPVANTAPAATTSLDEVGGTVANEPLDLNEEDVTAPVAGTEGPRPLSEVKTEVEQRIGPWQGNDPNPAFPLQGPFAERARTSSVTEGRTIACLRLARLRMQAGIASEATDDLSFGTEIANSDVSDELVQAEIDTLSKVVTQATKRQPVSRRLVPQAAPAATPQPVTAGVQRTTPSMAAPQPGPRSEAPGPIQATAASMSPDDTEFLFE